MRKRFCCLLCWLPFILQAQPADSITLELIQRHIYFLAGDSLKGRGNYTPELQEAAYYIRNEFKKAGLSELPGFENYLNPFSNKVVPAHALLPDSLGNYDPYNVLLNVIAVLPGKTRPGEAVIFSAHYDHIGTGTKGRPAIYNGANDNASGTTAVLALAAYFAAQNNNERTLIFCAFAGEEIGLVGSEIFSKQINTQAIIAMVNIEMIGTHEASGKNALMITGSDYSNLHSILEKNLKGSRFKIRSERNLEKNLFQRSDNYPFAQMGVPAHTLMASDDDDPCYHRDCDEVWRIDLKNMVTIIQAIATATQSIISGKDTPRRINSRRF